MSFPPDNKDDVSVSSYTDTKVYTIGSDSWTISNFNNYNWGKNWENIIKCGRKDVASIATISTKASYENAVKSVVVNLTACSTKLNSIKLEVSTDEKYSAIIETVDLAYANLKTGDNTFEIKSPKENCYYRLTFDCNKNGKNGSAATVSSVKYYAANTKTIPTITFDDASVAGSTITINEGEESSFPTHVATCTTEGVKGTFVYASDNACVTVDQNGKTAPGVGFGKAKITATFTPDAAYKDTYAESSAFYYIDYKEKEKTATTLSFKQSSVALTTLDYTSFTGQTPTLKSGDTELTDKSIVYSKTSDTNNIISTLNEDGTLVLSGNAGTAKVTATFGGDSEYASSTASYTISVKPVVKDIATLKPQITSTSSSSTQSFSLKLTDAIVTYKSGDNAYVQDNTGGLYTTDGSSLNVGDKINGIVDVRAYKKSGQRIVTSWTLSSDASVEQNVEFTPEVITVAQLNEDIDKYENMQVKVVGATVNAAMSNNQTIVSQNDETITLYSKAYNITWELKADDYVDIIGFPCKYNNTNEICVWRKGDVTINESVVATTLSLDPATTEYTVEKGKESAFTAPTVTVTDANNETVADAKITYKSSNTDVATVDSETGNVTFGSEFGTTTITASYAGDATHKAAKDISYTIIYGKVKTTMAWSAAEVKANIGQDFTAPTLSLTADGESILDGKTITYESSEPTVAEISETGVVTIKGIEGTTTITAKFAGDDTYAEASASYTLTVVDPNKMEVTFDFANNKYGHQVKEDVPEGDAFSSGLVTITHVKTGTTNKTKFYDDSFRVYDGAKLSISVPVGYNITKVIYNDNKSCAYFTCDPEGLTKSTQTWTGKTNTLLMTFSGGSGQFSSIIVFYSSLPSVALDESSDNSSLITENAGKTVNVTMTRTISNEYLNPICLPFAMDKDQIAETFGEGSKVYTLNESVVDGIIKFDAADAIEARTPYILEATNPTSTISLNGVTFAENAEADYGIAYGTGNDAYSLQGIYSPFAFTATDGSQLFVGKDNKLYKPSATGQKVKGFRAYFTVEGDLTKALRVSVNGGTSSIDNLMNGKVMCGKVYNLNGQFVGISLEGLAKGVYVMNGKKYIVK